MNTVIVTGVCGQLGIELVTYLHSTSKYSIVGLYNCTPPSKELETMCESLIQVDVTNYEQVNRTFDLYSKDLYAVYHFAAVLSGKGEQNVDMCWDVNINGLKNVLDACKSIKNVRICVPSSIAVFGTNVQADAPQHAVLQPTTMYGVCKVAGEAVTTYYRTKFGMDIRGVRLPGIISMSAPPGGGTTDFAVYMLNAAIAGELTYTSYIAENTRLPLMYSVDCIMALVNVTNHPDAARTDYNVAGFSASPLEIETEIKNYIPEFTVSYAIDFRDKIARSWPNTLVDTLSKYEWDWDPKYSLQKMIYTILHK